MHMKHVFYKLEFHRGRTEVEEVITCHSRCKQLAVNPTPTTFKSSVPDHPIAYQLQDRGSKTKTYNHETNQSNDRYRNGKKGSTKKVSSSEMCKV